MPLVIRPTITEGRVYRGKKKQDDDEEKQAFKEVQAMLTKNRKSCDCEAQIHELMENCLVCGRLSCSSEGPGKCFTCGQLVMHREQRDRLGKYVDIAHNYPSSSNQKQRVTQDPVPRINDGQYDIFAIQNKKHLRPEDKQRMIENLKDLESKRFQRELHLDFDEDNLEAFTKSVPKVENYEAELRKLQLSDNSGQEVSTFTLAQLVLEEYNKSYDFRYIPPSKPKPANQQRQIGSNSNKDAKEKDKNKKPTSKHSAPKSNDNQQKAKGPHNKPKSSNEKPAAGSDKRPTSKKPVTSDSVGNSKSKNK